MKRRKDNGIPRIPFESRFVENTETGCLEWQGAKNPKGYGHFKLDGQWHYAHRYAWERVHGPIPEGFHICHRCDNTACGNIEHLFLGTQEDNMRDGAAKGRVGRIPWKLSEAQVASIRSDARPVKVIAVEYGVTAATIYRVLNRTRRPIARQPEFDRSVA